MPRGRKSPPCPQHGAGIPIPAGSGPVVRGQPAEPWRLLTEKRFVALGSVTPILALGVIWGVDSPWREGVPHLGAL